MIIDRWLDLPIWGIFAALTTALAFTGICIHRLSFAASMRTGAETLKGVVPPFFTSVAILFALLTGFLANDIWDRNRLASRAILAERDGILAVHTMSVATVTDMSDLRASVKDYARRLIADEWLLMRDQESSREAGEILTKLLKTVSDPRLGAEAGAAAQGALLETVLKLRSSRNDRLAISDDRTDRTKWTAVLCLAFITQLAIAVVHLERARAQTMAMSIFSVAVIVTLGLIAIRERPFDGPLRFSSEPIAGALWMMENGSPDL